MGKSTATLVERLSLGLGEARRDLGLSQRQLAALTGLSRATVQNVEGGRACAHSTAQVALALLAWNMFGAPPKPEPFPRQPASLPLLPDAVDELISVGELVSQMFPNGRAA